MNTYVQDETIPVFITLKYEHNILKFPINPESLPKEMSSSSETADVEGIGEVSIPTKPKLATMTISSFFWQDAMLQPAFAYVMWLQKWQKSMKPATLIVTRFNYSMQVTCESFKHWINAGEEQDIYFELQLKEYRPYGARRLNVPTNETLLKRAQELLEATVPPVLIEIPRPQRGRTLKESVENTFTAIAGLDTLCAITKKLTGSTERWGDLYDENKEKIGNLLMEKGEIPHGTVLTVPDSWRGGNSSILRIS